MGSITQLIIGSTESITKAVDWDGSGKKIVSLTRVSDSELLSFLDGHDYTEAQVLKEFNKQRHFAGESGSGTITSPITIPGSTLTISPKTGLSNGDTITITVTATAPNTYKGAATGTISYTIPSNAMKLPVQTGPSFTGSFIDSADRNEKPQGTAAQKQQEFERITTAVHSQEFRTQTKLTSVSLPDVITVGTSAFYLAPLTSLNIPKVQGIGITAFAFSTLTKLDIPEADSIGVSAFVKIVNAPTTHVTMKSKFNTKAEKDKIFGAGNWDQITFTWV